MFIYSSSPVYSQGNRPVIYILGVAQDGGYPHAGCEKECCNKAWKKENRKQNVVCLALADPATKKWWLLEATPDIKEQLHYFRQLTHSAYNLLPEGIFITHAHIGHYTGLMELGREVMNTQNIPVYVLPKMKNYLENNGPWSQLVKLNNIRPVLLQADSILWLTPAISVTAFLVPHRDEYSETAGFSINTGMKKYLFIPDINKWELWQRSITEEVKKADMAFLDATFYDGCEIPGRKMSEVPHPFVKETMQLFAKEDVATRNKVCFIHCNHSNPLLYNRQKRKEVTKQGFLIAKQGQQY